jgi:PAS domain S-box-containing protein
MMLPSFETKPRVCMTAAHVPSSLSQLLSEAGCIVSSARTLEDVAQLRPHLLIVDEAFLQRWKGLSLAERSPVLLLLEREEDYNPALLASIDEYVTQATPPSIMLRRVHALTQTRTSETQIRLQDDMLMRMDDALIAVDNDNRVTFWNQGAERLYEQTAEQVLGRPLSDAYAVKFTNDQQEAEAYRILNTEGFWQGENLHINHRGREMIVESSVYTLRGDDGTRLGLLSVIRDITERRRVELAEREQRLMAEALRDTAAALTRTLDPRSVMNLILENVGRVVPHQTANIMTIEGESARIAFSRGYTETQAAMLMNTLFPLDDPCYEEMLTTGQPVLVEYTDSDHRWQRSNLFGWVRSYVGTPIRAYDHVIGFLNLDSYEPNAFSAADAQRLRAFADQAAIAIENAQLYDAIYRDASEMRALHRATAFLFTTNLFTSDNVRDVAEQIAQTVVHEFGKVDCGVMLLDDSGRHLARLARAGEYGMQAHDDLDLDGYGLVPEAIRTGTLVYAPDVSLHPQYVANDSRTRSELVVPLRTLKGVIGVLDLQSAEINAFDTHDQRMLQAFAERAASAIENMKLYSEIQQRVSDRTAELNRVKERAEAILNHSSDAILLLRDDGRIQQTNSAFNEMFGYAPDEAFGRSFDSIAGPYYAELLRQSLDEVVAEKRAVRIEITAINREYGSVDADVVMSPILTQDRVTSVVCSLRDISQRKRMEFELRDALEKERELNELKSRFIARASHEFRTPLAIISTASDLLKNYNHRLTDEQRAEKLNRMHAEIRKITLMLDDMLMISKTDEVGRQEFQPVYLDLDALGRELIEEMVNGIGMDHHFEFVTSGDCSHVYADRTLMRRAVQNLLSNAVKYSPSEGLIQLSVSCDENQTVIVIQDSGIGIPDEDQKGLFEAFHRGRNVEHIAGTGLGLAIVKQSIELHGGEVSFSSQVGIGSAFTLTIPNLALKEESLSTSPR